MVSSIGRSSEYTRGLSPAAMPSGTPSRMEMATDTSINDSVSIVGAHSPNIPGRAMATAAMSAVDHCRVRPTRTSTMSGNPYQGSACRWCDRLVSAQSTKSLIGVKKYSNSGLVDSLSRTQSLNSSIGSARLMFQLVGNPPVWRSP